MSSCTLRGSASLALVTILAVALPLTGLAASGADGLTSKPFTGAKANTGTVTATKSGQTIVLTLSDDFKVPDTPAPHWQVVDSHGNAYLLNRLMIKDNKYNKTVKVPSYVCDVIKVQIWCAWAETLLGEAPFEKPVM